MTPKLKKSTQVLMNYQKQANYRDKKRKAENQREIEKKAARKERDRLCYLKKKAMNLQRKQEVLKKEQKQLKQKESSVLVKVRVSNTQLKKLENQGKEVQVESTKLVNSMRKK